ncbi:MAG: hypothetical protein J0H29_22435 [Sphingobacteriales bacterium]|nr:hypothetical protein [Sphingobacteriales bacterium]OJY81136.1 MAG: hypothetical protein BGP14_07940 [Sphingobacteriales bacterium 44-15]
MEVAAPFVFQSDAGIVNDVFANQSNYLIEYDESVPKEYCIVYFSSNDLYYPNNETAFTESILRRNRFEWYQTRITYGHKHIFVRDIKKQWYIGGINAEINTPQKMLEFLKRECSGYKPVFLGSSAGGFIAVIMGQLIHAVRIYTFNGQFEILSLLKEENAVLIEPILYRNRNNAQLLPYYKAVDFIINPDSIFYFHSNKSQWDIEQSALINHLPVHKLSFDTSNHGVPFLKSNLPAVINLPETELRKLSGRKMHPLTFSLKMVGLLKTIEGMKGIFRFVLNKIYIHTIQRWKNKASGKI